MKMDETWKVFDGVTESIEEFNRKFVPEIFLRNEVNKDVVENFRVIKKLIEQSYFEYKFYDVAATQSMLTMEMALKLRYEELNNKKWDETDSLYNLIKWFQDRHYFEVYNTEYLHSLRKIRNLLAHPYAHNFSGPHGRHLIENTLDLINDLYEDPLLREKRMNITRKILKKLEGFSRGIKCNLNNTIYFAFRAWPAFVNNKFPFLEIHFYFNPTFHIPAATLEKSNWIVPSVIYFKGTDIKFNTDSILLKGENDSTLLISEINNPNEQNDFENWLTSYKKYCYPAGDYIYVEENLLDTFTLHLRAFHKL